LVVLVFFSYNLKLPYIYVKLKEEKSPD